MMRYPIAFVLGSLLFVCRIGAQSPNDGHVENGAYVNSYFHVSYRWAKILQPYDISSLHLPPSPYNNEFLLFSARQGDQPDGVVLVAEKLHVQTPHSSGLRDSADLMNRIMRFRPEQHVVILSKKHFTSANGLAFDEVDYTESGGYSAAVLTPMENFILMFKCNAQTAADLAAMTKSISDIQIAR